MATILHQAIRELCFVCGCRHKGTVYDVEKNKHMLEVAFAKQVVILPGVSPLYFCNTCYRSAQKYEKKALDGVYFERSKLPITWTIHTVIELFEKASCGGRRKKNKGPKGRPKTIGVWTPESIPPAESHNYGFVSELNLSQLHVLNPMHFQKCICVICQSIINEPIIFKECEHGCCRSCFLKRFIRTPVEETLCPSCGTKTTVSATSMLLPLIGLLRTECTKGCKKMISFAEFESHSFYCKPLNDTEKMRITRETISEMLKSSNSNCVELKGAGKPLCIAKLSKSQVEMTSANSSTVRNHVKEMENAIGVSSNHSLDSVKVVKEKMVRRMPKIDRLEILQKLNLGKQMEPDDGLAMLADLSMTWYTYRSWGRWMRKFGFKCPSEKKMRKTMVNWLSDQSVEVELTPFQHLTKKKESKLISAPMAYVPNLKDFIFSYLDMLDSENMLLHYSFMNGEIHIKFGGDHGLGSYKQSVQICNVAAPNSVKNTVVVNIFEAKDNKPNLKTALLQYRDQINDLQGSFWKGRKIRVFMFGDLLVLYEMYGLSGASGRHNCIWCEVKSADLVLSPEEQPHCNNRTLDSFRNGFARFRDELDCDIKRAKENFNIIDEVYFNIPLDQVVIPGLHITLGVFLKFFDLFELKCKRLDYMISQFLDGTEDDFVFDRVVKLNEYISNLEECLVECMNNYNWQMIRLGEEEEHERERLSGMFSAHRDQVREQIRLKSEERDRLIKENNMELVGPTLKMIDQFLKDKRTQKQSYHSYSFTGNHCHVLLKEKNISELVDLPVKSVLDNCPENIQLMTVAVGIKETFSELFTLYASCHSLFDSSDVVDPDLLDSAVRSLMAFWRNNFSDQTVTPKMHVLESHMVSFIKKWKAGFGFYGEQGGESIHKEFHKLSNAHSGMKSDPVGRLRSMVNKHHLRVSPKGRTLVPAVEKRLMKKT